MAASHGGKREGAGPKPKPPQEKGTLLKAYPPLWLYQLVQEKAKQTGKSLSEVVIEALKEYFHVAD
jgi:hypothetical protein